MKKRYQPKDNFNFEEMGSELYLNNVMEDIPLTLNNASEEGMEPLNPCP